MDVEAEGDTSPRALERLAATIGGDKTLSAAAVVYKEVQKRTKVPRGKLTEQDYEDAALQALAEFPAGNVVNVVCDSLSPKEHVQVVQHLIRMWSLDRLGYIGAIGNAASRSRSAQAKRNAHIRHAENRAMKTEVFRWLGENMLSFRSMDAAAQAIAGKVVPVTFRTARAWVGEWKKMRSASTV